MFWYTDRNPSGLTALAGLIDPASQIMTIKDSMTINAGTIDFDDARSIPDVWYIHRLYEMMLLHSTTSKTLIDYAAAVKRQWHAILAIDCFAQSLGLTVCNDTINGHLIANMPGHTDVDIENRNLMTAAWEARPQRQLSQHPTLDPNTVVIHSVLTADGRKLPFAMSSATSYLVPTADAWKNLHAASNDSIPWVKTAYDTAGRPTRYYAEEPSAPGMLSYTDRQTFAVYLHGIADYFTANALPHEVPAAGAIAGSLKDYGKAMRDTLPVEKDIFPDSLKLHYVKIENCSTAPDASDPWIGGAAQICTCSLMEGGKRCNYLVSLPISENALQWLNSGVGQYSVAAGLNAGKLQFTAQYILQTNGMPLNFTKVFTDATSTIADITDSLGSVAVWPRYKLDNWTKYYAFNYREGTTAATSYAIVPAAAPVDTHTISMANGDTASYAEFSSWPQVWHLQSTQIDGTVKNEGYLLTRAISAPPVIPGSTYTAAIDFGTSATMIYENVNDVVRPMTNHHLASLPIYRAGSNATVAGTLPSAQILRFFVPSTGDEASFAPMKSLLASDDTFGIRPMLLGNWAYFRQEAETKSRTGLSDVSGVKIYADLKWKSLGHSIVYTKAFLRELAYYVTLQTRANGCANMDVKLSFPSAMTNHAAYIDNMTTEINDASSNGGVAVGTVQTITESMAVAQHLRSVVPGGVQFCSIDIGGGTADIFLFKNDGDPFKLTWDGYESSLLCGARHILLEGFVRHQECLGKLINLDAPSPVMNALKNAVPQINSWISGGLSKNEVERNIEFLLGLSYKDTANSTYQAGHELCKRAIDDKALADPSLNRLRKSIAFRIAAIAYYAGMMTRGTGTQLNLVTLQFAGNGSKTLNWLSEDPGKINLFLSMMFNAGAGKNLGDIDAHQPQNIAFSDRPKHEVAQGAMLSPLHMGYHINEVLTGEDVTLYDEAGQSVGSWDVSKDISAELFNDAAFYIADSANIQNFLESFRSALNRVLLVPIDMKKEFLPSDATLPGIQLHIRQTVAAMASGNVPDKKSFFMIEADALYNQYF